MTRKLFVNIPVSNLDASVEFFTGLGFTFNPQFTDENATCMLVGEDAYFMLLVKDYFQSFTPKPMGDAKVNDHALYAITADTREEVDELVDKALASGATSIREPMDQGFMYQRSFLDLDGHHWEVFFMDMSQMPAAES
ncbi:putative lactoylglutathione lyase [Psychromicrobium silvestre]|uniref:Putative lactoylglutathione lyase n=1 Tax=Psychromicrobium silvestre TaxID=1645614 RepID=A0A7Y9LQZ6_9MICC|nr:VOC family protein [Psychromicrobium silvestre]NYE93999.1 putative lactoylglutathione lyase [Psychromicrobium silvestre]